LPVDTVKTWLKRGRRENTGEYAEFAAAVSSAKREPLSEHEVACLLGVRAREGSVPACLELLRWHRRPGAGRAAACRGSARVARRRVDGRHDARGAAYAERGGMTEIDPARPSVVLRIRLFQFDV